jgi:TPR repeat protein
MAIAYDSGKVGLAIDTARALSLYRQAAERGNAGAMRRLGRAYQRAELGLARDMPSAEAWFLSSAVFGNEKAAVELAELYLSGTEGVYGRPEDGYAVIERLAADGMEAARLRLAAALLLGQGVKANLDAAHKLLLTLEAEGVAAAAFRLAQAYEFGQGGTAIDLVQARAHYAKAAQANFPDGMDYYARALYAGRGGERDRGAAVQWWQRATDAGHRPSRNNLAWVRCSSNDPKVRDPVQGTRLVSAALEQGSSANLEDTLAACLAANGQFEQAIATVQRAIEQASGEADLDEAERAAFARRLALYQRGEAWFED